MRHESRSIKEVIDHTTLDEDYRQDLWMYYIGGGDPNTFSQYLQTIQRNEYRHQCMKHNFYNIYRCMQSPYVNKFLNNFTDLERTVIFLLLLGFSSDEIAEQEQIDVVRIQGVIAAIQTHTAWNTYSLKDMI